MSFELFRNPFAKTADSSTKFESLQDQLNASSNRKGLQYPIDLGTKDNQDFLLFTVYDSAPQSFVSSDSARAANARFDGEAMKGVQNKFDAAQDAIADATANPHKADSVLGGVFGGWAAIAKNHEAISNFYKNQLDDPLQQARLKQDTLKTQSRMSETRFSNSTKRTMYSIALYMPSSGIVSDLGTSYKGEEFGMIKGAIGTGRAAYGLMADYFDTADDIENHKTTLQKGALGESLKQIGIKVGAETADGVAAIAGMNLNSAAAIGAYRRKVLNPHMEFMFEKVNQRTYDYTFSFTPRNIDESKMVHDIIRIFRIASLPNMPVGSGEIALDYPSEFDIQYFRGGAENTWLPRISRCALSSVNLDFTPNGKTQSHAPVEFDDITGFHVSGAPPASINLKLSFQELSTLVRDDVQSGGF